MEPNYRCPKCEHYYFVDRMGLLSAPQPKKGDG